VSLPSFWGDPHLREDVTTLRLQPCSQGLWVARKPDIVRATKKKKKKKKKKFQLHFQREKYKNLTFDFDFHVLTPERQTK
jgi:hypothetical protein